MEISFNFFLKNELNNKDGKKKEKKGKKLLNGCKTGSQISGEGMEDCIRYQHYFLPQPHNLVSPIVKQTETVYTIDVNIFFHLVSFIKNFILDQMSFSIRFLS